jgi:tungstate transport system ATP-binding protein
MLYEITNLIKTYNDRTVLELRSLLIEKGRIISLLGPNGAGKTTLLEILAFLLVPTSGEIRFRNEDIDFTSSPDRFRLRKKIVLVQQQPIMFTSTVFRNVEFPMKTRGIPGPERKRVVKKILGLVGMESYMTSEAQNLSGGETQRVAIAQALACSPDAILLDEPMSGVDVENRTVIERIIREINQKKGISVIFATHDTVLASRISDKTIFLENGKKTKTINENIFGGYIETDDNGNKYCTVVPGLKFPVQTEQSGRIKISISPTALKIKKYGKASPPPGFSKGRLIQIADEQEYVRAQVDTGVLLGVLIPKETYKDMNFCVGEEVYIACPPEGIMILQ